MRTQNRIVRMMSAAVVMALVVAACSGGDDDSDDSSTSSDDASEDTGDTADAGTVTDDDDDDDLGDDAGDLSGDGLTIGYLKPPTGLFDAVGQAQAEGLELAADDIAAAGGVLGGELEIVEDQPTADRTIETAFEELAADGANLVVGPAFSTEAQQIIPLIVPNDAVVCGASTTLPGLTADPVAEGRFIRTAFDDSIVAVNAANTVRDRVANVLERAPRVTIVARGDSYGDSLTAELSGLLNIVQDEVTVVRYDPLDVALAGIGDEVAATEADLIVLVALEEGPRLVAQLTDAGIPADILLGLDGLASPGLAAEAKPNNPEQLDRLAVIGTSGPADFLTRLIDTPAGEVLYGAQAYDCAISFALAAEATGSDDPAEISAAVREVTSDGILCATYAECVALLEAGEDIDYDGPSGPIDIGEDGEPGGGRFITSRVVGGEFLVVADLRINLDEIRDEITPRLVGFIGSVQQSLNQLGFYDGPIDGQMNDEFVQALVDFQTANGLDPNGTIDDPTIAAIQEALAEQGGALTQTVLQTQQALTDLGYYTGPIDGRWTPELSAAIKALQADLGLPQTGILDEATLAAIFAAGVEAGEDVTPPPTTTTTVPAATTTTTVPETTTTVPATTTTTVPAPTTQPTTPPSTTIPVEVGSVLAALSGDPQFSELVTLLERPDMAQLRAILNDSSQTQTLFAPTNDAIQDAGTSIPEDQLVATLNYHLVPSESLDPLPDDTFTTQQGEDLTVTGTASPPTVSDASTSATIAPPTIAASSSRVWAIDTVLRPANP